MICIQWSCSHQVYQEIATQAEVMKVLLLELFGDGAFLVPGLAFGAFPGLSQG